MCTEDDIKVHFMHENKLKYNLKNILKKLKINNDVRNKKVLVFYDTDNNGNLNLLYTLYCNFFPVLSSDLDFSF